MGGGVVAETRVVPGVDGRELCVDSGGDPAGRPVIMCHGTPGARTLLASWLADAATAGVRMLCYDRPGYGGSTAQPGRSVADAAGDVRAIAEAFGYDRVAVWGISGGGPHALACAALLPDLVCAVASLASVAPYGPPDLDFFAGMGQGNIDDMQLQLRDPEAAWAKLEADREGLLGATVEGVTAGMETLVSPVDAAALPGGLDRYLLESMQLGLAPGGQGWWDDQEAHLGEWGFDFGSIAVPVQLWHGRHDQMVPFGHGEWLARQIPGVDARLSETDGHVTLFNRLPEVHGWLLEHF
jgi:pimeloyl-ACP methyl ester carboxylesterase